jgi:hypothetical protein
MPLQILDVKEVRGVGLTMTKLERADLVRGGIFCYIAILLYFSLLFDPPFACCKYTLCISVVSDKLQPLNKMILCDLCPSLSDYIGMKSKR